jgi:hypothetical protein
MSRTHEALLRAEAKHQSRYFNNYNPLDIEQKLLLLNLGKKQLRNQSLSNLKQSLIRINECIKQPLASFGISLDESSLSEKELKAAILPVLLKRKRLLLELIDTKVTEASITRIRSALKLMQNSHVREKIEKPLSWLHRKNQFLRKEYDLISVFEKEGTAIIGETQESFDPSAESCNYYFSRPKKYSTDRNPYPLFGTI